MVSLDVEGLGLDVYHGGAAPFFVTCCYENCKQDFYQWDVNPITRSVSVLQEDVSTLNNLLKRVASWGKFDEEIRERHVIVGQNLKYDSAVLARIGVGPWPWDMTRDTLIAGHLLSSNTHHDLTSLCVQHLGDLPGFEDIEPFEVRLKEAVLQARRLVKTRDFQERHGVWRIAKQGLPEMPSAKGESKQKGAKGLPKSSPWACDQWLPRAVAMAEGYPDGGNPEEGERHPWHDVLAEYSNTDSAATLALWQVMRQKLLQRGLWKIYLERMKLPAVISRMEGYGVTADGNAMDRLEQEFRQETARCEQTCTRIASGLGYDLQLPKSGNNRSLTEFCFGRNMDDPRTNTVVKEKLLGLPVLKRTDGGSPSLDKDSVERLMHTLRPNSRQLEFVAALASKRKRDTALTYVAGYRKYCLPTRHANWFRLHPSINPTGTNTLRCSHSNPNSANIGKQEDFSLRPLFGPPPGREWWACDFENVELRIPAYESGEECMVELFEKPDQPPFWGSYHLMNASIIYPDLFWPLAEQKGAFKKRYAATWYQWVKNFGFAFSYSCGEMTGDRTAHKQGAFAAVKDRLKKHTALNDKYVQMAERDGLVETLPDRTVDPDRGYPINCVRVGGRVNPTEPLCYHVSGTAMQASCKAMVRCDGQLEQWRQAKFNAWMVLQVHDELVFDFPAGGLDADGHPVNTWRAEELRLLMQESGEDIGIPLRVAVTYCPKNWGEGTTI